MKTTNKVISLAQQLISIDSVTPNDNGCQDLLIDRLTPLGFNIEKMPFGEVDNFWARRGDKGPLFVFAGHTDVVPTGPLDQWASPPFEAFIRDNKLYGRGAADMKSSIAAMVCAYEDFIAQHPNHKGSIAFLITSDEEGPSIDGSKKVVETLKNRGIAIDYCLIGEATSEQQFGDTIKIGRRGSLSGKLIIHGKQGHIAYPQLADNPIHKAITALHELTAITWDQGNDYFPASQLQISNIHSGTGATNVIPSIIEIDFNFRYSPEVTAEKLKQAVEELLEKNNLNTTLNWHNSGKPFYTPPQSLATAAIEAIPEITGNEAQLSTSGGTSDGRFIVDICKEIVELGPINESIHQVNEHINIKDLEQLKLVYERILTKLLVQK